MAPDAGEIYFAGQRIDGWRADQVCAAGIGRTFQIVRPFAALTVLDNVMVGALLRTRVGEARRQRGKSRATWAWTEKTSPRLRADIARSQAARSRSRPRDPAQALAARRGARRLAARRMRPSDPAFIGDPSTRPHDNSDYRACHARSDGAGTTNHRAAPRRSDRRQGAPETIVRDPRVLECYLGEEAPL